MTRSHHTRSRGPNFLAFLVACSAVGMANINFDPDFVGGTPAARGATIFSPQTALPPAPPLPTLITEENEAETAKVVTDPQRLEGIWALKMVSALLERGCDSFKNVSGYTTSMYKQERVGEFLSDGHTIETKIRHEPFSVYMKWLTGDRGRQLIYVDGQNDGNMLVQPGGIRGRLVGVMSLDPAGTLAMSESRHSITEIGLLELARKILNFQKQDIQRGTGFHCELLDNQTFEDRPCYLFTSHYDNPEINATYRKSIVYIDKELAMPICVKNFTWVRDPDPETIDEESLIEFYAYSNLEINHDLTTADFDTSTYRLRSRR